MMNCYQKQIFPNRMTPLILQYEQSETTFVSVPCILNPLLHLMGFSFACATPFHQVL